MKCLKCGTELTAGARFCNKCGALRPELLPGFEFTEGEFAALKTRRDAGELSPEDFDKAVKNLVVQDSAGTFWMLGAESGEWQRFDGKSWVRAEPPVSRTMPATLPESRGAPAEPTPTPSPIPGISRTALLLAAVLLISSFAIFLLVRTLNLAPANPQTVASIAPTAPLETISANDRATALAQDVSSSASVTPWVIVVTATSPPASATPASAIPTEPTLALTSTPIPPTATLVPPTPTSRPNPTPNYALAFSDDMSNRNSGLQESGESANFYDQGEYVIQVFEENYFATAPRTQPVFSDFALESEARIVDGPDNSALGVIFRYQDNRNYYCFMITGTGEYKFYKKYNGVWQTLGNKDWTLAPQIKAGKSPNTLKIVAHGPELALFANGEQLFSIQDPDVARGSIGFAASTAKGTPSLKVAFDNLKVTNLSGESPEVLFQDDFASEASGWGVWRQVGEAKYENGAYVMRVPKEKDMIAYYSQINVADFMAEVDSQLVEGYDRAQSGMVFRHEDAANYYYVVVTGQGYYKIAKLIGNVWLDIPGGEWARSSYINTGSATNRLKVIAQGPQITLYVNDRYLATVTDSSLRNGSLGPIATSPSDGGPVQVSFDNLRLYAPGAVTTPTTTATSTATAMPTATATRTRAPIPPTPEPPPVGGPCPDPAAALYWSDDFSNAQSGWMDYSGADYSHFYKDGEFHFAVTGKDVTGNAWIELKDLGTRYRLQVRTRRLGGPELNNYGLLFGGQDDFNYSTFRISDSGSYRLARYVQDHWEDLVPWTQTSAVDHSGNNTLTLLVDGTQIYACVNNVLVSTANDPALKTGRVGMILGAYDEPVHVHFDDIVAWKLQGPITAIQQGSNAPPATSIPSNVPPGVFVTGLRTTDPNPNRNADVSFVATFLNSTGAPQNFDWLVMVYQPDAKKAFGETAVQRITVPVGVSEFTSPSNWSVRGPGGCVSLYARPYFQNPDSSRTLFKQTDGSDVTFSFTVCP